MTIRNRFLVGAGLILAIVAVAGVFSLRRMEAGVQRQIRANAEATAASLIELLDSEIYGRILTLRTLALTTEPLAEALAASNLEFEAFRTMDGIERLLADRDEQWRGWAADTGRRPPTLIRQVSSHPVSELLRRHADFSAREVGNRVYAEIFVTNRYGANVAQTNVTSDYRQSDEEWWTAAQEEGMWVGDVDLDESSGAFTLDAALRVEDGERRMLGVLKASLDISGIQGILDALRVNHGLEEEQVHLLDRRGHRLYPEFTANPVSPLAAAGASDLVVSGTAAGRSRYPDLGWTVTLIYPAATVFEPQLRLRRNLLTIALLGLLAVLVVAGLVSVSVTRPMRAAVGVANRVAEGDLSLIEESKAGGEIGELLDALRMMVAKIRPIVTRIRATSKLLGELAPEFTTASQGISSGAEKQALATAVSRSSVEEMVDSMRVIASNTEELGVEVADTSAAIEQMAVSGDSVAQNARRLATGVSDTVALAHHLAESVAGVAVSASKAAESSQAAVVEAQAGGRVVRDTAEEIAALTSVIEQVAAVNGALAADNERIHGIVHLLESIGGKTKLLALNAAIQATQAGPYGRSFGVVAAEIRALAEDSSASARRMGKLLESVHSRIGDAEILSRDGLEKAQRGVDMVTNAGRSLERIVASAGEVDRELSDIRRATAEQAAGSEQLQTTFHRMSTMTEEVATATEQQGRGGERILGTVRRVHGIAERFSEAVRGHSAQGEAVESSITQIVEIAAQSETSAKEIVAAATALEQQVAALRSVSGFFDPPASKAADDS